MPVFEWVPLERVDETAAIFKAVGADVDYRVFEGKAHKTEEARAARKPIGQFGAPS